MTRLSRRPPGRRRGLPASGFPATTARARRTWLPRSGGLEKLAELPEGAKEQLGRGPLASAQATGDLGEGVTLEVMLLDGPALVVGQSAEGVGQTEQLLVALGLLTGRGALGRQPRLQARRRFVE